MGPPGGVDFFAAFDRWHTEGQLRRDQVVDHAYTVEATIERHECDADTQGDPHAPGGCGSRDLCSAWRIPPTHGQGITAAAILLELFQQPLDGCFQRGNARFEGADVFLDGDRGVCPHNSSGNGGVAFMSHYSTPPWYRLASITHLDHVSAYTYINSNDNIARQITSAKVRSICLK